MRKTPLPFVARGFFAGIVVLSLAEALMVAATLRSSVTGQWGFRGNEALVGLAWGSIGALIALRQPQNRMGWLLLALSLVSAIQGVVDQYPALARAFRLAGDGEASWVSAWIWVIPATGFLAFVPLIFPDGRLPSQRWRAVVVLGLVAIGVFVGSIVISIRPLGRLAPSPDVNPALGVSGPIALAFGLYFAAAVAGVGSILLRYRHARGDERRQLKWVAYALVFVVMGAIAGTSPSAVGQLFFITTVMLTAVAVGIAILHYRLYEIDVIVNRTIVYGALTAILAGIYTASISLSQRVFLAVTGERSDAAIVVTTLILVTTITPIHTRLQAIVDRRVKPAPPRAAVASDSMAVAEMLDAAEERLRDIAREEVARSTGRLERGQVVGSR